MRSGSSAIRLPCTIMPKIHSNNTLFPSLKYNRLRLSPVWASGSLYLPRAKGMATPAMNMKRGITRSHGEKPSHFLWVKHSIIALIHGVSTTSASSSMISEMATKNNRSMPLRASSDSRRCFIESEEFATALLANR